MKIKQISAAAALMAAGFTAATAQAQDVTLESLQAQIDAMAAALEAKPQAGASKTTIGGYGEHHLNKINGKNGDGDKDSVDAHRFVLFIGHQYSDDLKFFSELEVEHGLSGNDKPGEVELEQAYIEKTFENNMRLTMGQFLIPAGFLNETHEPDTFYGVERNAMEKNIIPTTWWETGAMLSGDASGVGYDVAVHSGLNIVNAPAASKKPTGEQKSGLRNARQKSAKAKANDYAVTVRVKGSPTDGLELAATVQRQTDLTQAAELDVAATLISAQAAYQYNAFAAKALYATWDIDENATYITKAQSKQEGYTAEVSYKVNNDVGVFTRFSTWDNEAGDSTESAVEQSDIGVNYWLAKQVVVKADYQMLKKKSNGAKENGVNLGLGWSF